MITPPPVSKFCRKTHHSRHQRLWQHHVTLVAVNDAPLSIVLNPLPEALCEPALPRNVVDAKIAHVLAEANIKISDKNTRIVNMAPKPTIFEPFCHWINILKHCTVAASHFDGMV